MITLNTWKRITGIHLNSVFLPQCPFIMDKYHESVEVDTILCQEQYNEGIVHLQNKVLILNVLPILNYHSKVNKNKACVDLKPETSTAIER